VSDPHARNDLLGGLSAAASAILFGAIIIWGRFVLERGIPVETMLSIRFAIGALVLLTAILVTRRPTLAEPGERLRLVLLALFGYAIEASIYFTATQHGTVATVTLLFFTYPVFVTVWAWAFGGRLPARLTIIALVCAVAGAVIVVGAGTGLAIDGVGVVLALTTALTYSVPHGADLDQADERPHRPAWVSAERLARLFAANVVGHGRFPRAPPVGRSSGWASLRAAFFF
jgi:drug/metabolite transporter (DMT)-like permease